MAFTDELAQLSAEIITCHFPRIIGFVCFSQDIFTENKISSCCRIFPSSVANGSYFILKTKGYSCSLDCPVLRTRLRSIHGKMEPFYLYH